MHDSLFYAGPFAKGLCRLRLAASVLFIGAASAASSPPIADQAAYAAFGVVVAQNIQIPKLHLSEAQFEALISGLRLAYAGQTGPALSPEQQHALAELQERVGRLQQGPPQQGEDPLSRYLRSAREGLSMQQAESGLLYRIVTSGGGARPRPTDTVIVNLTGKAPDAKTELAQLSRTDVRIKVSDLLPGIAEGVQMVALGGTVLLILPPQLSFGNGPWPPGLEPGMPLVFQVELKDIVTDAPTE